MNTPIELLKNVFESDLVNTCTLLKNSVSENLNANLVTIEDELKNVLNKIFENYECTSVLTTNNTDNILFGINVDPTIIDSDLMKIIMDSETIQLTRYSVEIDLKLCSMITAEELAAYLIEEIASIMDSNTIDNVRGLLDLILNRNDDYINIRQSLNYSQILIFGIKDTIKKIASFLYKNNSTIATNKYSQIFELDDILKSTSEKIKLYIFDDGEVENNPKLGTLNWTLRVYKDVSGNYRMEEDILKTALSYTGSQLEKREIQRTLKCLKRALNEVLSEASYLEESLKGFSLFKSLKQNGLRSIEDDLYEYKIRTKNCETEDEAMYILRQINTRIAILEDYIYNTDISENEANRWRNTISAYRVLREELSKKKISNKKSYGIFVDYDKLDQLD